MRAGVDIDVGIDAALADEPELGEARQERRLDLRSFADQDQDVAVSEALSEHIHVLYVIVPDRDVEPGQLGEARQRVHGVEVVIQDRDFPQ